MKKLFICCWTYNITLFIYIFSYIGVWVEGSTFWLQIEIKGFEFPELLFNIILSKYSIKKIFSFLLKFIYLNYYFNVYK